MYFFKFCLIKCRSLIKNKQNFEKYIDSSDSDQLCGLGFDM